ncbi:MAG: hypothetical protein R2684_16655 [Pyrinomonadaceae bacterium]
MLYARVYLPNGNGTYQRKRKKLDSVGGSAQAAKQWVLEELANHKHDIPNENE